jgi:hypothetical protein
MIAITEVTRAAAEGERATVREIAKEGIKMVEVWQTKNDEIVCTICGPRHGKKVGDGWSRNDGPPAHPRCRCWINHEFEKPVEEEGNVYSIIENKENEIRLNDYETAVIYDQNGNIILEKAGHEDSVIFTDEEIDLMKNTILTHNHPSGQGFSPEDINFLIHSELLEIRSVGKYANYSMKNPIGLKMNELTKAIESVLQKESVYFMGRVGQDNDILYNQLWKEVADMTGLIFTKVKI